MATTSSTKSKADYVKEYITSSENVHAVSASEGRTFAVTDRRVIDVREVRSSDGRSVENVESTLFADVVKVDVSIQGSTTNSDMGKIVAGILLALIGVVIAVVSLSNGGGTVQAVGILIGLVALGIAAWLLMNATEKIPGGIIVKLYHGEPDEESMDRYHLPESQDETARAVLRGIGDAHTPRTEGQE